VRSGFTNKVPPINGGNGSVSGRLNVSAGKEILLILLGSGFLSRADKSEA
jgi:hypothetical protein